MKDRRPSPVAYLLNDPLVRERALTDRDLFLCQSPSLMRSLFLYWPWAERLAILSHSTVELYRVDLSIGHVREMLTQLDRDLVSVRHRSWRRRVDLMYEDRVVAVFRGSEAQRFVGRLVEK